MNRFNIRVYGILVNENKEVLVADEFIRGSYYTKFPGGMRAISLADCALLTRTATSNARTKNDFFI